MQLPSSLLDSLASVKGFDREALIKVHESGEQVTSIRLNPSKPLGQFHNFPIPLFPIPWSKYGFYLPERPSFTFDPLFHAGCYYVQEASGMFLEQALKQTVDLSKPVRVLDLCAAPGGKSTHIQSLISNDSLLVSNETIRSRANILKDNIIKWGCENVMVTNNDPAGFAELENYFDVIIIDAPCSGSGLFRREPEAIHQWSRNHVQLCSQRQQRIVADVWPALKNNGILIYSTCAYSRQEDEDIVDWITGQFGADAPHDNRLLPISVRLVVSEFPGIVEIITENAAYAYRFFPDKVKGEGFFMACFCKQVGEIEAFKKNKNVPELLNKKEVELLADWVIKGDRKFIKNRNSVYVWPEALFDDLAFLLSRLSVIYSGTLIGELMRDKLVPDHALAMCNSVTDRVSKTELDYQQAIQYLQRKDLRIETKDKGWQLVTYSGHTLGWIKVLPGRINNYYPKALRILKDKEMNKDDTVGPK